MLEWLRKYERSYGIHIELNPFSWAWKPRWYRSKWEKHDTNTREGQFDFLFFGWNWYRELKTKRS